MTDYTLLVNALNPLPDAWQPEDMVDLYDLKARSFYLPLSPPREMRLVRRAAYAANDLLAAADRAGFTSAIVTDAWHSRDLQAHLLAEGAGHPTEKPGCCDSEAGLTFSVSSLVSSEAAPLVLWVQEHGAQYGFVLRYPNEKMHLTGVGAKPPLFRYVGENAARQMAERGWCLEEYHAHRNTGVRVDACEEPQCVPELQKLLPCARGADGLTVLERIGDASDGLPAECEAGHAQELMRCFFLEGILQRISSSDYRRNLALYGSALIASVIGLERTSFHDVDLIVCGLGPEHVVQALGEVLSLDEGDGVCYKLQDHEELWFGAGPDKSGRDAGRRRIGHRLYVVARRGTLGVTVTVDAVEDAVMVPGPKERACRLAFAGGTAPLLSCSLETALAKKLGHVVTRGELSRAKHLYDIHAVAKAAGARLDAALLGEALTAEVEHDGTLDRLPGVLDAIEGLRRSDDATLRWGRFKRQAYYAGDASWQDVLDSVEALLQAAIP